MTSEQAIGRTPEGWPIYGDSACANCGKKCRVEAEGKRGIEPFCGLCGATWGRLVKPVELTPKQIVAAYKKRKRSA